jgi:hypothetical protein
LLPLDDENHSLSDRRGRTVEDESDLVDDPRLAEKVPGADGLGQNVTDDGE